MLTEQQRQHFRTLQQKDLEGTLSPAEQAQLQTFVQQIEAEEAALLAPATERIRQKRHRLEEQNAVLASLIRRKERLARRLERVLALSNAEREKINTQAAAILNTTSTGASR